MRLAPILAGSVALTASVALAAWADDAKAPAKPSATAAAAPPAGGDPAAAKYRTLLNRYCIGCHNAKNPTAGLALDASQDLTKVEQNGQVWERVVRKLRGRMMPPPGMPRPDDATYTEVVSWLEGHLDHAQGLQPDPGRVVLHRLNRKEYVNAVRDLFALKVDPEVILPQDDTSDSFDNVADVLQVSASFLDQNINAARTVAIGAVGDSKMKATRVNLKPDRRMSQGEYQPGLPLGTRGGLVADYVIPAEGDYQLTFTGPGIFVYDQVLKEDRFIALVDGKRMWDSAQNGPALGPPAPVGAARQRRAEIKIHLTAGKHHFAGAYVASTYEAPLSDLQPLQVATGVPGPVMTNLEIAGPNNPVALGHTPSRDAVFVCHPKSPADERPCATRILSRISRLAFRRPVTQRDLTAPMRFYDNGRKVGGFETGVQEGIMAVMASPSFLYRTTDAPRGAKPGDTFQVSDIDLASRLSFFLWSSIPDDELLKAAEQNKLHEPKVLEAEVRRMLADPRADSLVTNFAYQWLHLEALDTTDPDLTLFPEWDESLRSSMKEELHEFIGDVFHNDRNVLTLLNGDYTFVNERMARHYGLQNITGNGFRRVHLTDPRRYGLLGKAAILTVTAYPDRTSPVIRGAWLLENIMGTPPSPPPPNVGGFPENVVGQKTLTVRELLAQHRKQASCNACHGIMDPLGLSLENFDAIGEWRDKDRFAGEVIDASSTMVSGEKMNGVVDLRAQLMKRPEQFVRTLTEKLMVYGLGRSVDWRDMPTIRAIVRKADAKDDRFSALVLGVIESDQFKKSKVPTPKAPEKKAPVTVVAVASR
jgi:mono/diheme cytochrome c family protein